MDVKQLVSPNGLVSGTSGAFTGFDEMKSNPVTVTRVPQINFSSNSSTEQIVKRMIRNVAGRTQITIRSIKRLKNKKQKV